VASDVQSKPRQYVRPIPKTWWLKRPAYTKFMVRELTSGFIAAYTLLLLALCCGASEGDSFHALFTALSSPPSVAAHLVVLFFALFHTITFFNLTPRAIVVRIGEEKLPERMVQAVHYVGWVVVSLVLFALAMMGS
jgi:fumarate reductase subunit C